MRVLSNKDNLIVLYEDNHLIAINKRPGDIVQGDKTNDVSLDVIVKQYLKEKYNKPGQVFLGVIHRLDRPTSGIVIFAKTSKALTRMNEQFKSRKTQKTYLAITKNKPPKEKDCLEHFLVRYPQKNYSTAFVKEVPNSKKAILDYEIKMTYDHFYLLQIELHTGRHHQIRAQLSAIGCPIKGDLKYGSKRSNLDGSISLHAYQLNFEHPVTKELIQLCTKIDFKKPF